MEEAILVSSTDSYIRLMTDTEYHRMITLALAYAVEARFRSRCREERIEVTLNGSVALYGRYLGLPVRVNFFKDCVGICDMSNEHRRRPVDMIERILRSLVEEDLRFGKSKRAVASFGRGAILSLGPKEEVRASCLIYVAVLRHTRRRVANRVARRLASTYPHILNLVGKHLSEIEAIYIRG